MRSRRVLAGVVVGLTIAAVAGCGGSGGGGHATGASASGGSGKPRRVAMFLVGPKNDKSFDQGAYEGALDAVRRNPQLKLTAVLENRSTEQQDVDAITTLAPNNDLVVGVGGVSGAVIDLEADKFPNTTFLTVQGPNPAHYHKNVYSLVWDPVSPYVAGAIAATLTRSHVVGVIGGADISSTIKSDADFTAGVRATDPTIKVLRTVTGDYNNVPQAKAAAGSMLADRADVIYPFLDAGVVGVYAAARDAHKLIPLFKLDFPDCRTYPNMVGANDYEDTRAGTSELLDRVVTGKLKPAGVAVFAGLQDPRLQTMQLCPKYARDKTVARVARRTIAGIRSGRIPVPHGIAYPRPDYPYREGFDGPLHNASATGQ